MIIETLIQRAYLRFNKSVDYPSAGSEDWLVLVEYGNMAIEAFKREAKKGTPFESLVTSDTVVFGGTGIDTLPSDFLAFIADVNNSKPAKITDGAKIWQQISKAEGKRLDAENRKNTENRSDCVFYVEGKTIKTFPAISASIEIDYLKEPIKYTTGAETDPVEIDDDEFIVEYMLAFMYLDDGNLNQYNTHFGIAQDSLDAMSTQAEANFASDSDWGMGM
jgi:hypothetical protein